MKDTKKNSRLLYKSILNVLKKIQSFNTNFIIFRIEFLGELECAKINGISLKTNENEFKEDAFENLKNIDEINIASLESLLKETGFNVRISNLNDKLTLDMIIINKLDNKNNLKR